MRIAVSGAHGTGKTTLIDELLARLPSLRVVEEPYHAMIAEGHAFLDPPERDDYTAQLDRSIASLTNVDDEDVVFDRCPADFLAYLAALPTVDAHELEHPLEAASAAMTTLDLVVYVPIEDPDRIAPEEVALPRLRRRVDALLREMLADDAWGLGVAALEVVGSSAERAAQVAAEMGRASSQR